MLKTKYCLQDKNKRIVDINMDISYMQQDNTIDIYCDNTIINRISQKDFEDITAYLHENENTIIKENSSLKIKNAEQIIQILNGSQNSELKSFDTQKSSIYAIIGQNLSLGIISEHESTASYLLTASSATNFIFEVKGIDKEQAKNINDINSNTKIKDRIDKINEYGRLRFKLTKNKIFESNLIMIDSCMNEIIAYMLEDYYTHGISDCKSLIKRIEDKNPLGYLRSGTYESKFKKLLSALALGMTTSAIWDGTDKIKHGFFIIKKNGDIQAFDMHKLCNFETYLLNSTKFETASSSRYKFASIYNDSDNTMCIDLNLQIRLI